MEETFIGYLAEAAGINRTARVESPKQSDVTPESEAPVTPTRSFDLARLWAYARRETVELLRDPIRIAFALLGPIVLMAAFGYGISFDIENLQFAAFDQDNTPESQQLLDGFRGSRYFSVQPPITSAAEEEARSRGGGARLARLAGLYAYPKQTVLGKAPAEDGKPVSTFLKDDRFLLAYAWVGFYNRKRHGQFSFRGRTFFRRRSGQQSGLACRKQGRGAGAGQGTFNFTTPTPDRARRQ